MSDDTPTTWPGMLWGQLMNDDERIRFLKDGGGAQTGIMAPAIVDDIVEVIETRRDLAECLLECLEALHAIDYTVVDGAYDDDWFAQRKKQAAALLERLGM